MPDNCCSCKLGYRSNVSHRNKGKNFWTTGPSRIGAEAILRSRAAEEAQARERGGREVEALVGLVLGVLPQPSSSSSSSVSTSAASTSSLQASPPGADDLAKQKNPRGEKAGLAGLASVPTFVMRMILRRRERSRPFKCEEAPSHAGSQSDKHQVWFARCSLRHVTIAQGAAEVAHRGTLPRAP
ncbi:hypothetical protein FB451DRAFT_1558133 [Mycena latifolia]|nr:hypothetical protein FB451DRAFT_1558133 [Mycena latifolia]